MVATIFNPNEVMIAVGTRGIEHLITKDKKYTCLYGNEKGIFPDRPYVSLISNEGKQISIHASRFKKLE